MKYPFILLIAFILPSLSLSQISIWEENFDNQINKGVWGDGKGDIIRNLDGVNWTLDYSQCTLSNAKDYLKVDKHYSGGRFEARDCDGEAVWESPSINILNYENINISLIIGETGTSNKKEKKYIKVYTIIDGVETLFFTNGKGLGNFGKLQTSTTIKTGKSLKIRIKLRTDYAQDIYFDNIKIEGKKRTSSLDKDSEILVSENPILNQKIIAPNGSDKLHEVFRFKITDKGTADKQATKLTSITLNKNSSNTLNWTKELTQAKLNTTKASLAGTIHENTIVFEIPKGLVEIADNSSQEFSLQIQTTKNIEDQAKFVVQVNAKHSLKTANESSSLIPVLPHSIVSNVTAFEVQATKIHITQQPSKEIAGQPFSSFILAQLIDNYGNVDTNSSLIATITVANGSGSLSPTSSLSQTANNGQYKWKALRYNRAEVATFQITTDSFSIKTTPIFFDKARSSLIKAQNNSAANDTILSSRNTIAQAKDFFKISIKDQGDDGLPTILKTIRIEKGAHFSHSKLFHLLGGILVKQKGLVIGEVDTLKSSNGSAIEIPLKTPLTIKDGEESEITISIFLSRYNKLEEGAKIQLAIPQTHRWETDKKGSDLISSLHTNISSPILTVDATATKLVFEQIPRNIVPNSPFSITIAAVDDSGIIDKNYNAKVILSREAGTGVLSSSGGLSMQFTNGKAIWKDLKYNTGGSFTLLATTTKLTPVESSPINANDTDSELQTSPQVIPSNYISSTVASKEDAQSIFAFSLQDKGTNDNRPTILTQIIFKNAHPHNEANWKTNIAGAVLLQDEIAVATTDKISSEEIKFRNTNGITTIANGKTANLSLAIFLKYNNIEDSKTLQCKIKAGVNGFKTHSAGSSLQKLDAEIISNLTTIDVTASKVDFLKAPYAINTAKTNFTIQLAARDTNGNIDTDYAENVTIKDSSSIASTKFTNGVASFLNIQQNGDTDFTLRAESNKLQAAKRHIIISPILKDLKANFEDKNLKDWSPIKDWKISVIAPIAGKYSLKHNLSNTVGASSISKSIGSLKLQNSTTIWRWQMKNGEWNPSSRNNFCYVLASTNQNLAKGISYIVGVNQSTSNDILTLSKVENEKATVLLSSEMIWQENGQAGIQVKLDNEGNWELAYDNNGGFDNLYVTGATQHSPSLSGALFTGCIFKYGTASRAGQFWIDDIEIYHFNTAPEVRNLKVISETKLAITFSEEMESKSCEQPNNYLTNKNIQIQKAKQIAPDSVILTTSQLKTGSYNLKIKNLKSLSDIPLADTTIVFSYFEAAEKGEIIINELMIDEQPAVKLPTYEYIELFNKANKPFILKGWTITVGKNEKTLPTDTIQPDQYLLLCSSSAQKALSAYGKAITVNGFPSLPNTSGRVILKNENGLEIDQVSYKKVWYNDKEKEDGGWSLERISSESPSNSRANWAASHDKRGGTPAEKNSVNGIVIDNTPPSVENVVATDKTHIEITFSEPIDTLAIQQHKLFFVNNIGYAREVAISQNAQQITLEFSEGFEYGKTYQLSIKEIIDLFGNAHENIQVSFGLPELAVPNEIIINEILFNPAPNNADYVELYNHSNKIIDLATLRIATRDEKGNLKTVTSLSKSPRLLKPTEFVVLTTNAKSVMEQYEVKNPQDILEIRSLPKFPNNKGIVLILNQESTVIDEFHYIETMHLQLLRSKKGVSLERIHYDYPTQDTNNWHSAAQAAGFGTPTYANSSYSKPQAFDKNICIVPKVFSPNGDGIDDSIQIHYQFDNPGQIANVSIFDSNGHLIRDLTHNLTLSTKGSITWDGIDATNKRAHTGRYIIFIELFDSNGNISSYKKSCVLHGHFK